MVKSILNKRNSIILFVCMCFSFASSAAIEHTIASVSGTDIAISTTTPNIVISDQYYPFTTSTAWAVKGSENIVTLRFDDSKRVLDAASWSLTVTYTVKTYNSNGSTSTTTVGETLTINGNPTVGATGKDKDIKIYTGGYKTELTITAVSYNGGAVPSSRNNDIYLDVEQKTERYYYMDYEDSNPAVVSSYVSATNELAVYWSYLAGSESYDIEWLFIDIGTLPALLTDNYDFDFRNATRINTTNQYYNIPLAYPQGVILFRVRGVGVDINAVPAFITRVESLWSVAPGGIMGNTSTLTSTNDFRYNWTGLEPEYNWQYSAAYAEEGKRKEVISFFDGSLHNRQTATILNSDNNAVLAETKYDYEGRPAVQMLPTPLQNQGIRFYGDFNPNYDKTKFDEGFFVDAPDPMGTSDKTGKYYSPSNLLVATTNSFLPDAEGYPFSRTRYKQDGTNRVIKQSGVGINHTIGSGHETKYYYGTPTQVEVDRLFGNEVGFLSHYKKNMVLDANGQVSVSYMDQSGRVIATALAGTKPDNLLQLEMINPAVAVTSDLLTGNNATSGDTKVSLSTILVSAPGTYTFNYELNGTVFCQNEPCDNICENCKYDLFIEVRDENNTAIQLDITASSTACATLGLTNYISCTDLFAGNYSFQVAFTDLGTYTISKTIKVHYPDAEDISDIFEGCLTPDPVTPEPCATCSTLCADTYHLILVGSAYHYTYLTPSTPITTGPGSTADSLAECLAECNGELPVMDDECTLKRNILLDDMSPGGQYFDNIYADEAYENAWLEDKISAPGTSAFWTAFNAWVDNVANSCTSSAIVTFATWDEVRDNWQDCFANFLVNYHPEICMYNYYCNSDICGSEGTLMTMSDANEYEAAMQWNINGDYYNPLNLPQDIPTGYPTPKMEPCITRVDLDYFNYNPYAANTTFDDEYFTRKPCVEDMEFACDPIVQIDVETAMKKQLQNYILLFNNGINDVYANIYYVLEDPDNIKVNGAGAVCSVTLSSDVVSFFRSLHGDPNAAVGTDAYNGLFGGGITKYEFFKSNYLLLRRMIQYKKIQGYDCNSTTYPNSEANFIADTPEDIGYYTTTISSLPYRYQIRYPENDIFETILNACPPFDKDAIATAVAGILSSSNADLIASCESSCEGKAEYWMSQINDQCNTPGEYDVISEVKLQEIRTYLAEICAGACSLDNPEGADNMPDPGISHSGYAHTGPYNTFAEVFAAYGATGCATAIVHPGPDNSAGACSCENLRDYISGTPLFLDPDNLSSADLITIVTALNGATPTPSPLYTVANVQHWITLCGVNPNTDVSVETGGLSNLPADLKCAPKDWAMCSCKNLTDFIAYNGLTSATNSAIAIALSDALGPDIDYTAGQISDWRTTCADPDNDDMGVTGELYDMPLSMKCADPDAVPLTPCEIEAAQAAAEAAYINSQSIANAASGATNTFLSEYKTYCLAEAQESFTVTYTLNEYYYTLYYYDQAGNLIKTVPPNGVALLDAGSTVPNLSDVTSYRLNPSAPFSVPAHTMVTNYKYNSLQQLIEQTTPDGGTSKFWYDVLGRLVVSQNEKQLVTDVYSYTVYDNLGRINQVGEIDPTATLLPTTTRDAALLSAWLNAGARSQITRTYYDESLTGISAYFGTAGQENLRNRVATSMITADNDIYTGDPLADALTNYNHATHYSYDIHGNVKTLIQEDPSLVALNSNLKYDVKQMDYEYDLISGNVNKVSYQNQLTVDDQPQPDRFYHQYYYDADNRITEALTSFDNVIWQREAKYFYYPHGPLSRTEIGDKQVQGTDYAYTIQGWIKGVNSNTIVSNRDIGKDGLPLFPGTSIKNNNSNFAYDAMGYTLGYFSDDYKAINRASIATTDNFEAVYATGAFDVGAPGLFNGNIRHMVNGFMDVNENIVEIMGRAYEYDQLNRIRTADSYFSGTVISSNSLVSAAVSNKYSETFNYDLNGNILAVTRTGNTTTANDMDQFSYTYWNEDELSTYTLASPTPIAPLNASNKLARVADNIALGGNYADDVDNQVDLDNYQYDKIGNLIVDKDEEIMNIDWSVYGKIRSIRRVTGSVKDDMEFKYDASGNRICKIVKPRSVLGLAQGQDKWIYTYYVRDASGNIMSTYTRKFGLIATDLYSDNYNLDETNLFGSSRVGLYDNRDDAFSGPVIALPVSTFTASSPGGGEFVSPSYTPGSYTAVTDRFSRTLGYKLYELSNHLGNVIATVSDKKTGMNADGNPATVEYYIPDALSSQDYYSFGAPMPGRGIVGATGYRYGFNGKEDDNETVGSGNGTQDYGLRIYNPSLGKFLSVDPLTAEYPWYTPYQFAGNMPIWAVDLDGAEEKISTIAVYTWKPIVNVPTAQVILSTANTTLAINQHSPHNIVPYRNYNEVSNPSYNYNCIHSPDYSHNIYKSDLTPWNSTAVWAHNSYLAERFIIHYEHAEGKSYKLNYKEMRNVSANIISIRGSDAAEIAKFDSYINSIGVGESVKIDDLPVFTKANTFGTLGRFYIHYSGTLTKTVDGNGVIGWTFEGSMYYQDKYDFNGSLTTGSGEDEPGPKNWYGYYLMDGTPFSIISVPVPVTQSSTDSKPTLPAGFENAPVETTKPIEE